MTYKPFRKQRPDSFPAIRARTRADTGQYAGSHRERKEREGVAQKQT